MPLNFSLTSSHLLNVSCGRLRFFLPHSFFLRIIYLFCYFHFSIFCRFFFLFFVPLCFFDNIHYLIPSNNSIFKSRPRYTTSCHVIPFAEFLSFLFTSHTVVFISLVPHITLLPGLFPHSALSLALLNHSRRRPLY